MKKSFWIFLAIGVAVLGVLLYGVLVGTKGNHLELSGSVLKVRAMPAGSGASFVVIDFRVTNPSDIPFVVKQVSLDVDGSQALIGAKSDLDAIFASGPLLGPKYNDVLSLRDKIGPHQSLDRMVGARIELNEQAFEARKKLTLRIEEADGVVAEITQ